MSGLKRGCGRPAAQKKISRSEISGGGPARPHAFPWVVRILSGCAGGLCAGTLVTARHVLTAYHCTYHPKKDTGDRPCDHSDGQRVAVLGRDKFDYMNMYQYYKIPIIDVKYQPHAKLGERNTATHDFALLILQRPAKFSAKVRPICFPKQGANHYGLPSVAVGWGRFTTKDISESQSPHLKQVKLIVSRRRYKHRAMFGTVLRKKQGTYQDPCSGDSGGPLMYRDRTSDRWVIIGTVQGGGFDCRTGQTSTFEGSDNGLWNKVSSHSSWIQDTIREERGHKEGDLDNRARLPEAKWFSTPLDMVPQKLLPVRLGQPAARGGKGDYRRRGVNSTSMK